MSSKKDKEMKKLNIEVESFAEKLCNLSSKIESDKKKNT